MRDPNEIEDQLEKARDNVYSGEGSRWPGMTYEMGVEAALTWVTGESDGAPMDGDE
jgi:hypothetical protein